jgi:quinolinate synthase
MILNEDVYKVAKASIAFKGFIDLPVNANVNFREEILQLKKEKQAIILAHYYQLAEIQEIADFVGDSLALAQKAAKNDAKIILFAGVHFMAETAKILSPDKKVLIPDVNAGCSLANSCPSKEFKQFLKNNPDHVVISYVNTTAEIKALSDIICTSGNAMEVVNSIPLDKKIIFAPDRNLGNYISKITGRDMLIWNGACHVHEDFSLERILELKKENPEAKILAHPECEPPVRIVADFIGSTAAMLQFTKLDASNKYIIATETGILHQMKKSSPQKVFIPAPPKDSTCGCNDCAFMKLITLKKLYLCLKYELPEVQVIEELRVRAELPIRRMLELSVGKVAS